MVCILRNKLFPSLVPSDGRGGGGGESAWTGEPTFVICAPEGILFAGISRALGCFGGRAYPRNCEGRTNVPSSLAFSRICTMAVKRLSCATTRVRASGVRRTVRHHSTRTSGVRTGPLRAPSPRQWPPHIHRPPTPLQRRWGPRTAHQSCESDVRCAHRLCVACAPMPRPRSSIAAVCPGAVVRPRRLTTGRRAFLAVGLWGGGGDEGQHDPCRLRARGNTTPCDVGGGGGEQRPQNGCSIRVTRAHEHKAGNVWNRHFDAGPSSATWGKCRWSKAGWGRGCCLGCPPPPPPQHTHTSDEENELFHWLKKH